MYLKLNSAGVVVAVADSRDDDTRAGFTIAEESGGVCVDTHTHIHIGLGYICVYVCVCIQYAEEGRACLGWPTRSIYRGETGTPAPPHSRRLGGVIPPVRAITPHPSCRPPSIAVLLSHPSSPLLYRCLPPRPSANITHVDTAFFTAAANRCIYVCIIYTIIIIRPARA
jgi:hypothetical protein